jgi:hypothetical protein
VRPAFFLLIQIVREERISMTKMVNILMLVALMAAAAGEASAQTTRPPATLGFVNVNVGAQTASHSFDASQTFPLYGENATATTSQKVGSGTVFDISGGYRFKPTFGVAIGFSNFSNTSASAGVAVIPDPLIFGQPRSVVLSLPDLRHTERTVYFEAVWFYEVTGKIDVAFSIGPSFNRVGQEVVSSVTVAAGTQNATPVVTTEKKTAASALIGVDGTYMVTQTFGAGVFMRYVGGKVDLPSVSDLKVGGFQIGAGARVRF